MYKKKERDRKKDVYVIKKRRRKREGRIDIKL